MSAYHNQLQKNFKNLNPKHFINNKLLFYSESEQREPFLMNSCVCKSCLQYNFISALYKNSFYSIFTFSIWYINFNTIKSINNV